MLKRLSGSLRSSAGFATVGLALTMVAVTSLVIGGVGSSKSLFEFGTGFAWFGSNGNDQDGKLTLVDGATGLGTANSTVLGSQGSKLRVVNRDGHAYVVEESPSGDRELYRLDDVALHTGAKRSVGPKQTFVRGGDRAYLVDEQAGTVESIDPEGLQSAGAPLKFRPPIRAAADDEGRLVVVEMAAAAASVVQDGAAGAPASVGSVGDELRLATVGGRPTVVNTSTSSVVVFDGGKASAVTLPQAAGEWVVPDSAEGDALVILRRNDAQGRLVIVDTAGSGAARVVPIDVDVRHVEAPLASRDAVYLVDPSAGQVTVLDAATGATRQVVSPPVGKGVGNFETFVKDGYLWVNNPNGNAAAVIDHNGVSKDVEKFKKNIPETNPAVPPEPPPLPPDPVDPANPSNPEDPAKPPGTGQSPSDPSDPGEEPVAPPPVINTPGVPGSLRAAAGNKTVTLTWVAPANGGAPIERYQLTCSPDCGPTDQITIDGAPTTYDVEDLKNGSAYSFSLVAENSAGPGKPAAVGPITPTADVPPAPSVVVATEKPDGTVDLTWKQNAAGLEITGYTITATSDNPSIATNAVSFDVASTAKAYTTAVDALGYDGDATPDWSFTIAATATDPKDATKTVKGRGSAPSNTVDPYKAPSFAVGSRISATAPSGQAQLSWPTAAANGRAVTYQVTCQPSCGSVPSTSSTGTTITGLSDGTSYTFVVAASNAAGAGAMTASVSGVVPHNRPVVTLTASGPNGYTGVWVTVSTNTYGMGISRCDRSINYGGASATGDCTSRFDFSGLTGQTTFTINVCVTNSANEQTCATRNQATNNWPTITMDTHTYFSNLPAPAVCGGTSVSNTYGVGSIDNPGNYAAGGTQCRRDGTQWQVVAECIGGSTLNDQPSGVSSNRWFKILNSPSGAWVNSMWVSGNPGSMGVPASCS